ncbi:epidermal growth factor receptor kinase substrate 8-like protein 1 isoform X2 [Ixodes scapularis]
MAAMPGVMKLDSWEDGYSMNSDFDPYSVHKDVPPHRSDLDMRSSRSAYSNGYSSDQHSDFGGEDGPSYLLEHLATFSVGQQYALESPKDGLRKLFQMEKSKGIWTQKMKMKLDRKWVIIIDCENGDIVERFPMSLISDPTAFTSDDPRELYNNILVFVVQDDHTSGQQVHAEMHIFQCVRISAQEVVDDIKAFIMGKWKGRPGGGGSALPPPPNVAPPEPPLNGINVREQVSIFNAVSQGSPPTHTQLLRAPHDKMDRGAPPGGYARESNDETSSTTSEKYEREVWVQRWTLLLGAYNNVVQHKGGKANIPADALSWLPVTGSAPPEWAKEVDGWLYGSVCFLPSDNRETTLRGRGMGKIVEPVKRSLEDLPPAPDMSSDPGPWLDLGKNKSHFKAVPHNWPDDRPRHDHQQGGNARL